jgi:predicted transcriptional regulator
MGQVTIYLDDDCDARMKRAAKASGVPVSRWVEQLIREKTANEWPEEVKALVGAWADFPCVEDLSCQQGDDLPRESL